MKMSLVRRSVLACALSSVWAAAHAAPSGVVITEWMYSAGSGEYIEFTNLGNAPVDFTGWSFDDDSRTPGAYDLSGFGVVAAGESVVLTEAAVSAFRAAWGLDLSVKVLGLNTNNLGRNDEINLYNAAALVDRLTYGDQTFAGTIRTQDRSGRTNSDAVLGANNVGGWIYSVVGDADHSRQATTLEIGSPGFSSFSVAAVPEPGALAMLLGGIVVASGVARRRKP